MQTKLFLIAVLCLLLLSVIGHAQQTLVGIGAALQPTDDGYIVVGNVIKGGPADKSGQIHPQDKIRGIGQGRNGRIEDINGMPLADAMALIKGDKGTVVRLDVLSGGNSPSKIVELVRDEIKIEPTPEQELRFLLSPQQRLGIEADKLATDRSVWGEYGSWRPLRTLLRAGGDVELGLTENQKQQLSALYRDDNIAAEWAQQMRQNPTPEYTQAAEALAATRLPGDPYFESATEEQKNAYREAQLAWLNLWHTDLQTQIQETLSPEQMLQVRKLEMQLMPELGIPFPSMFEPLDLTEEQKKEMKEIADELKAEFDNLTMEAATLKADRLMSAYKSLQGKSFDSMEEFNKVRNDAVRQYVSDEEMSKRGADLVMRGTRLVKTLQTRLMDVLTDEQLVKMQKILDETPEFAKNLLAQMKAGRVEQEKSPIYVPGPDSWRPGMPMPVEFKEQRQGRFPRVNQGG